MISQKDKILKHLQSGKAITQWEAATQFGCWRLGARILELRSDHNIETEMVTKNKKRFANYYLNKS